MHVQGLHLVHIRQRVELDLYHQIIPSLQSSRNGVVLGQMAMLLQQVTFVIVEIVPTAPIGIGWTRANDLVVNFVITGVQESGFLPQMGSSVSHFGRLCKLFVVDSVPGSSLAVSFSASSFPARLSPVSPFFRAQSSLEMPVLHRLLHSRQDRRAEIEQPRYALIEQEKGDFLVY